MSKTDLARRRAFLVAGAAALVMAPIASKAHAFAWPPAPGGQPGFGGNGNTGSSGNTGSTGAAPLPLLGLSALGQTAAAGGLVYLWRRRKKRSSDKSEK